MVLNEGVLDAIKNRKYSLKPVDTQSIWAAGTFLYFLSQTLTQLKLYGQISKNIPNTKYINKLQNT